MKIRRGTWLLDLMMLLMVLGLIAMCGGAWYVGGGLVIAGVLLLWVV